MSTTSFFKKGSNAKIMNQLSFQIQVRENDIEIKNNKTTHYIELLKEEYKIIDEIINTINKSYYKDIVLIKKGVEWIFSFIEEKYHKYINIKIKCSNIYTENALKEWINLWFSNINDNQNFDYTNKIIYREDLYNIYTQFKKCKILIN